MIFNILFLPFVFFLGLITSYQDTKYGKVKNKWIILGLSWGLIVIVFFFAWYFVASPITRYYYFEIQNLPDDSPAPVFTVSLGYLSRVMTNAIIALVLSYLMWRFGAWAAGDAKLFAVYALLIPLEYYWKSYLPYFPSFVLLINIFIPIFLYLLIRSIIYFIKFLYLKLSDPKERNKKIKLDKKRIKGRIKGMGIMALIFITIFLAFGLFQEPIQNAFNINISSIQIFIFAGLIIFSSFLAAFFKKPIVFKVFLALLVVMLIYGLSDSPSATWQIIQRTLKMMIIFMTILNIFRALIDFHILKTGTREIRVKDLKPGMNLDEEIINRMKRKKKLFKKYMGHIYPGGLTPEQVDFTKKWLKKTDLKKVSIYKLFPFVTWMFIGVIITLILKSSLLHLLIKTM